MRLIDADKLKEVIHCAYSDDLEIIEKIDKQPTAFDVDRIVEQLKEKAFMVATSKEFYFNPQNGEYVEEVTKLEEAIKIVKGGGIE